MIMSCEFISPDCSPLVIQDARPTNWTRRLVVTRQPTPEFYKDEGGKSNSLSVQVSLVEFDEYGQPARTPDEDFISIPLRVLLYFESGKKVDQTDQNIFRFVGNEYDSIVIRAESRKVDIYFRLEKVSRRKDGQRFKLRIEVDYEQCAANMDDLQPVFTTSICVLSKRKHHRERSSSSLEPPSKICRQDLQALEESVKQRIDILHGAITKLSQQISLQNEHLKEAVDMFNAHPGKKLESRPIRMMDTSPLENDSLLQNIQQISFDWIGDTDAFIEMHDCESNNFNF